MLSSKFLTRFGTIATILMLALSSVQPAYAAPSNDNFAEATKILALPFSVNASNVGATFEVDEPTPSCWWGNPLQTVWFAYTASSNVALTIKNPQSNVTPLVAVYTGSSLNNLSQVSCQAWGYDLTFLPQAGVTYYFQLSGLWGDEGNISFALDVTPPPQVQISFSPSDPNVYDTVSFYPYVNDPVGVSTFAWSTSDGATSNQYSFYHKFPADGDYTVNLTVTTSDGRTGSGSQVVQVKTHDVAISKISAPQSANSGQTRAITVSVNNKSYAETVWIALYKSTPNGFESIGSYSQYVPARSANRTVTFTFNYTFTSSDASIGKVTFKAVATIQNARDALPADNEAISSPPTKVGR